MLALAFETNRTTLISRAEHQKRRRDIGEVNLAREIRELTVMLERQVLYISSVFNLLVSKSLDTGILFNFFHKFACNPILSTCRMDINLFLKLL